MLSDERTGHDPVPARASSARSGPPGLTRRSLLGAAVTSVIAGSTAARLLQRLGVEEFDERAERVGLIVAQHGVRVDTISIGGIRAEMGRAGAIAPFSMVGLSARAGPGLDLPPVVPVAVRVRRELGWSPWTELPLTSEEQPDAAPGVTRALTSPPMWVGFADAIELEVSAASLPGEVQAHLVRETPLVLAHHSAVVPVFTSNAPQPAIAPRSQWNAKPFKGTPTIASGLDLAIVHHTAGGNGYSAGEVPGIIAGIQQMHMSPGWGGYPNGWSDIAYNFMVDRFGRLWEARQGGIRRAVVGGHSAGHNTRTTGICLLGHHDDDVRPSAAAVEAIAALAAWKLGIHGVNAATDVSFNGTTRPRIIGHRDVGSTACPGRHLYPHLGDIRQTAFVRQVGFPDVPVTSYYAEPVAWLVINGITTGVGSTGLFKPDDVVDRAQMATFLWRTMGSPAVSEPHGFPDVPAGVYYEPAVRWARATGVTDGVGDTGRYQPSLSVSRAQMAAFLWRLAGSRPVGTPHGFPDVPADSYYEAPVRWLKANEITTGVGTTGLYKPDDPVTRAQMATFLFRLASREEAWAADAPLPPAARF